MHNATEVHRNKARPHQKWYPPQKVQPHQLEKCLSMPNRKVQASPSQMATKEAHSLSQLGESGAQMASTQSMYARGHHSVQRDIQSPTTNCASCPWRTPNRTTADGMQSVLNSKGTGREGKVVKVVTTGPGPGYATKSPNHHQSSSEK